MPGTGLNSLQRTQVPPNPWPRARDRGAASVSPSRCSWNLMPPRYRSLLLGEALADSLESVCAQKAPLSKRCLSILSLLHSLPSSTSLWTGTAGVSLGTKLPGASPAPSSISTSNEAQGKVESPQCSFLCLLEDASSMAHRKHHGSLAISLSE